MAYRKRKLEDLNVMDDFLFSALTSEREVNTDFCRTLLSALLDKKIGKLRVISQRSVPGISPEHRGIRMDVEIEEVGDRDADEEAVLNVYDIEPHIRKRENYARHNRFYQAKIDSRYMSSGSDDFAALPNLYVITITDFDPFGQGYMQYTVQNQCREVPELMYDDGVQFIYFYTGGKKGGNSELQELLTYLQNSTDTNVRNEATRKIHSLVNRVKGLTEVKQEFMTWGEYTDWVIEEGIREGIREEIEERTKEAVTEENRKLVLSLLGLHGTVPELLKDQLQQEEDIDTLRSWCIMAARAGSIEEFQKQIESKGQNR